MNSERFDYDVYGEEMSADANIWKDVSIFIHLLSCARLVDR